MEAESDLAFAGLHADSMTSRCSQHVLAGLAGGGGRHPDGQQLTLDQIGVVSDADHRLGQQPSPVDLVVTDRVVPAAVVLLDALRQTA